MSIFPIGEKEDIILGGLFLDALLKNANLDNGQLGGVLDASGNLILDLQVLETVTRKSQNPTVITLDGDGPPPGSNGGGGGEEPPIDHCAGQNYDPNLYNCDPATGALTPK